MELGISEFWKVSKVFVTCDSAGSDSSNDEDAGLVEHDADFDCTEGTDSKHTALKRWYKPFCMVSFCISLEICS